MIMHKTDICGFRMCLVRLMYVYPISTWCTQSTTYWRCFNAHLYTAAVPTLSFLFPFKEEWRGLLKTDSGYLKDAGFALLSHSGKPWESPPLKYSLVSSTSLRTHPFQGTGRTASGRALAPEPSRATRNKPEVIRIFSENTPFSRWYTEFEMKWLNLNYENRNLELNPLNPNEGRHTNFDWFNTNARKETKPSWFHSINDPG